MLRVEGTACGMTAVADLAASDVARVRSPSSDAGG